jgi:hypothetical protein
MSVQLMLPLCLYCMNVRPSKTGKCDVPQHETCSGNNVQLVTKTPLR